MLILAFRNILYGRKRIVIWLRELISYKCWPSETLIISFVFCRGSFISLEETFADDVEEMFTDIEVYCHDKLQNKDEYKEDLVYTTNLIRSMLFSTFSCIYYNIFVLFYFFYVFLKIEFGNLSDLLVYWNFAVQMYLSEVNRIL